MRALSLAVLVLLCAACRQRPAPREYKGRIITLTDSILTAGGTDTIRFGRLGSGEIASLGFRLSNAASRPVAVVTYARNCGCTTLEFDSEPIAPGQARQLTLLFDSRGQHGWQLKTVDLTLSGAPSPFRLFVEAEIE